MFRHTYIVCLCASCGCFQCHILHDLQFVNAGPGCKEATIWKRGITPESFSWLPISVSFCLPHPVAVSAFIICSGLCDCTEMLWICVLYVSFRYKVRPRTFGCLAMGSVVYFEVQIALMFCRSEQSVSCFCLLDLI